MWNQPHGHGASRTADAEPPPAVSLSMPEDDANSVSSRDDASSADETTPAVVESSQNGSAGASKKRKRTKYQKTSYVVMKLPVALLLFLFAHVCIGHVCTMSGASPLLRGLMQNE